MARAALAQRAHAQGGGELGAEAGRQLAAYFDGRHRVLRGGSWATHSSMARVTFRNWDWPIRRQIFSGFRCARDA